MPLSAGVEASSDKLGTFLRKDGATGLGGNKGAIPMERNSYQFLLFLLQFSEQPPSNVFCCNVRRIHLIIVRHLNSNRCLSGEEGSGDDSDESRPELHEAFVLQFCAHLSITKHSDLVLRTGPDCQLLLSPMGWGMGLWCLQPQLRAGSPGQKLGAAHPVLCWDWHCWHCRVVGSCWDSRAECLQGYFRQL